MYLNKMGNYKVIDRETITKARLCATGFEETQEFRTDSLCCTGIGIRAVLKQQM